MNAAFTESVIEQAAMAWLESLGYLIMSGLEIAPGKAMAERENYGQVVIERRLSQARQRLNPVAASDAVDEVSRKLTRPDSPSCETICDDNALFDDPRDSLLLKLISDKLAIADAEQTGRRCA